MSSCTQAATESIEIPQDSTRLLRLCAHDGIAQVVIN